MGMAVGEWVHVWVRWGWVQALGSLRFVSAHLNTHLHIK